MATEKDYQDLQDRMAALRETVTNKLSTDLISNPQLADALVKQIDDMFQSAVDSDMKATPPPDKGLAQLVGVGPEAAAALGQTRLPQGVEAYDETVTSEHIVAVGDLYYLFQHEKIGVFRVVQKLQELFRAGAVRLYERRWRLCPLPVRSPRGPPLHPPRSSAGVQARAGIRHRAGAAGVAHNTDFHRMFAHFINQVALFSRDKRISDVIRKHT